MEQFKKGRKILLHRKLKKVIQEHYKETEQLIIDHYETQKLCKKNTIMTKTAYENVQKVARRWENKLSKHKSLADSLD